MAETNIDYEEQREQVAEVAMQMILHAGDARELIMKALDAVGQGRYEEAQKELIEAKEELRQAHVFQTSVIQSEAAGTKYEYSLLFILKGYTFFLSKLHVIITYFLNSFSNN